MAVTPLLVVVTLALAAEATLDAGVRTEASGGLVRAVDGPLPVPTADMRLKPVVLGAFKARGFDVEAGYSPEILLRASFYGAAPLFMHRALASARAGTGRGPHLDLGFGLAAGDVDFTVASRELESPFGLASQGGIVSLAGTATTLRAYHRPTDELDYGALVQLSTLTTPTAYEDPIPPNQVVPRAESYAALDVGRFDEFRVSAAAHGAWPFMFAVRPRSPRSHPAYVGVQPEGRWTHQWTRTASTTLRAGALVAYQRTGLIFDEGEGVLYPVATASFFDKRRMLRWARVESSFTAGVAPLYDPFLVGLTERAFVQLGNTVELGRQWEIESSAQYLALVASKVPELTRASESDDQIMGLSSKVARIFSENFKLEGGGFAGLRVDADHPSGVFLAPHLVLYVALEAGFGLDA